MFDDPPSLRPRYSGLESLSFSFVPARIDDNQALLCRDPGYSARQLALGHVERAQLLEGNSGCAGGPARGGLLRRALGEAGVARKLESARLVGLLVEAFAAHGLPVDAAGVRVTGDKGTRANSLASTAGVGGVWLVTGAWNEPYLAELHAFPDAAHDDRVDASARAFNAATEIDAAGGASVVNEPEGVVDEWGTRG